MKKLNVKVREMSFAQRGKGKSSTYQLTGGDL
jgi:hypothetical protein